MRATIPGRRLGRRASAIAALAAIAACAAPAGAAPAATARLVFERGCDIWLAHPSGTPIVNLTPGTASCEVQPSLSRTGRYVAWHVAGLNGGVWVYDAATGASARVAARGAVADFSPTSDELALQIYDGARRVADIYTMQPDGSGLRNWTNDTSGPANGSFTASWGADGQSITFARMTGAPYCRVERGGYDDLYPSTRLARVTRAGALTTVVGSDAIAVYGGQQVGSTLAYSRAELPATAPSGTCASEPDQRASLVVDGRVVGPSDPYAPSVTAAGEVAYSSAGSVRLLETPAGVPRTLFSGSSPDWGVAYVAPPAVAPLARPQRLSAARTAPIATVVCPARVACTVSVPGTVPVRIGGRAFSAAVLAPRRVAAGRTARVRVRLGKAAAQRLRGRSTTVRMRIRVTTSAGGTAARRVSVVVRGRA